MSDLIVAAPAAGWYPDPIADGQLRWWNGEGWTERTMAPQPEPTPSVVPAVEASEPGEVGIPSRRQVHARLGDGDADDASLAPGPSAGLQPEPVPYTEVDYAAARQAYAPERTAVPGFAFSPEPEAPAFDWQQTPLPSRDSSLGYTAVAEHQHWRPTKTSTAGAWGLAFLPWTATALAVTGSLATGYAPVAPYAPAVIGLIILLLSIALAQRDRKRLRELGHDRPASEWWVLLAVPLAYLIARTVSVHRNSGKGIAPLMMFLANCVFVVAAALGVAIFLPVLLGSTD